MRRAVVLHVAAVVAFALWLAACASNPDPGAPRLTASREAMTVIRHYYEGNAAEENNACSAPIMTGVTRSEVVSDSDGQLVVDVRYSYGNYAHRGSLRCRGSGDRRFTLTRGSGGYRVVDMTGERRLGPTWRIR